MVTKRTLLPLALMAILGACSKSPDEPVVPSPRSAEPETGISLNGEIEFSDVPPQLGASSGKELSLASWVRLADNKRFLTPYFNDDRLPAVICIYDGHGNDFYFRAALHVTRHMSRNGMTVNKFTFHDKRIPCNNEKGLPEVMFKKHKKPGEPGYSEQAAPDGVIQYREKGNEDIYIAVFIGLDPDSNNPEHYTNRLRPENQEYTHGCRETRMGEAIDYTKAQGNPVHTRLIFATTPEKHKLNLSETGGSGIGSEKAGASRFYVLSNSNLKIRMRGVLLECQMENTTPYPMVLKSVRVDQWGGQTVRIQGATRKTVTKPDALGEQRQFDLLDLIPSLEPTHSGDGRGPHDPFEVKFFGTDEQRTLLPHQTSNRLIYLPLVNAISNGKIAQTPGVFRVRYSINGDAMAEEKKLRPLKRDGFLASTKFQLTGKPEKN